MTILNTSSSWNVGRVTGRCAACGADLPPNTTCWATLCDAGPAARVTHHSSGQVEENKSVPAPAPKGEPAPSPFIRVDFCETCWEKGRRPEELAATAVGLETNSPDAAPKLSMFSFWKTTVPLPQQKKKLLVDDSVLLDVFFRMECKTEPQEIRFRFVLALILMRKRLLRYEGMEPTATSTAPSDPTAKVPEIWRMTPRLPAPSAPAAGGSASAGALGGTWADQPVHVTNPHLTAEQITEVSQQLSAILAEEI